MCSAKRHVREGPSADIATCSLLLNVLWEWPRLGRSHSRRSRIQGAGFQRHTQLFCERPTAVTSNCVPPQKLLLPVFRPRTVTGVYNGTDKTQSPGEHIGVGAGAHNDAAHRHPVRATFKRDGTCGFPFRGLGLRSHARRRADHHRNRNYSSDCHIVPPWLGPFRAGSQIKQAASMLRNQKRPGSGQLKSMGAVPSASRMSALGQKQTWRQASAMAALFPIADEFFELPLNVPTLPVGSRTMAPEVKVELARTRATRCHLS